MLTIKDKLEQYHHARLEMQLIDHELHRYHTVSDVVTGSLTEFPYSKHTISVSGIDTTIDLSILTMLEARRKHLKALRLDVETYLAELDDCYISSLIRLRYFDGLSWQATAMRMGGGNSADGVRKTLDRFLAQTE